MFYLCIFANKLDLFEATCFIKLAYFTKVLTGTPKSFIALVPDEVGDVIRNSAVAVTPVRLEHHVAPLLRAHLEVDVTQTS